MTDRQTERQTDWRLSSQSCSTGYETFWITGRNENFLQKLAAFSSDEAGRPNAAEFLDFWRKRFSVQLQKCIAQVISKKLSMLCSGSERPDCLSTQFFLISLSYI